MKTTIKFSLILLILFTLSCKKEDFREIYTGSYTFKIKHHYNIVYSVDYIVPIDTIYYYIGNIQKSSDFNYKITVDWGNGILINLNDVLYTQKNNFTIDSQGNLSFPEMGNNYFFGKIKNDTINFTFHFGGYIHPYWQVTGTKIK